MKKKKSVFLDINRYLVILILIIWSFFSLRIIIVQIKTAFKTYFKIYALSLEQKYRLIDGNFYDFLKFCKEKVPEGASIIFKFIPTAPEFRTQEWFTTEYLIGRSPYYLYPRKIFREKGATEDIKYKIVYDTNAKTFNLYTQ